MEWIWNAEDRIDRISRIFEGGKVFLKVERWNGGKVPLKQVPPDYKAVSSRPVGVPAKARSGLVG